MFAQRLAQVSESATLKVAAEAERLRRAGYNVVDFSAGEPDFPTPEHVKAAGKAAHRRQLHPLHRRRRHSGAARGDLRALQGATTASTITPAEVLLTVGGKQALFNAALALFDPGDEVITHAPYWPTIPEQVKLVGATPVIVHDRSGRTGSPCTPRRSSRRSRRRRRRSSSTRRRNPTGALDRRGDRRRHRRRGGEARHLDHRRSLLRAADLRGRAAQPAEGAVRSPSRPDGAGLLGVEGVRDDRLALRLDDRAEGADHGLQHHPGADDVEHHVDHAEGGAGGAQRVAGAGDGDARRVPAPARQHPRAG